MVQSRVAASIAAWGWQSSNSSATIPIPINDIGMGMPLAMESQNNVSGNLNYLNHAFIFLLF
jgi:hypothetical protein